MKIKQLLEYEMIFWAIIMLLVSSFTLYYGWHEKIGIDKLKIYGCPDQEINPLIECNEEDKVVVGLEIDHEYTFRKDDEGNIYDPYGHYARKKRITYYLIAVIIILGSLAAFKIYRFVKSRPKVMELIRRKRKEHEKE